MNKKWQLILGLLVGIPVFLGIISASTTPHSSIKSAATQRFAQIAITPIPTTHTPLIKITVVPTKAPTITPKPAITPFPTAKPTVYIAPTEYIAPTTPPQTYQAPVTNNTCAGQTAICNDGTCSDSAHHQGTCSHHGGVAQWL
jgi:uncharacterized protein DUF3761